MLLTAILHNYILHPAAIVSPLSFEPAMLRYHSLSLMFVVILFGCKSSGLSTDRTSLSARESQGATVDGEQSIKQVSAAANSDVVLFTDSKELQYDTGAVDPDAPSTFEMTESGLRYRVLRASNGRRPAATNTVTVHYRGWLDNGNVFDSSYDRGMPTSFPLNGVIAGWTEGMQLIGEGGMIELWVPARLGYGTSGSGGSVPPNATLHFVVELLKVK